MTQRPVAPLFRLLNLACGVFLLANIGSFALVNIALTLGLLTSLLHRPLREGLLRTWPGRTGQGVLLLLLWVFFSQAANTYLVQRVQIVSRLNLSQGIDG